MKFRILSQTEQELYNADVMAIVDYTDVSALGASTTGTLNVCPATTAGLMPALGTSGTDTIPANFTAALVVALVDTAFVSSTATGLTMTVGDSGSNNRFLTSSQLQSGQTPIAGVTGSLAGNEYYYAAATAINAYFTSTTANLSTFTAGSMRLFFSVQDMGQLAKA